MMSVKGNSRNRKTFIKIDNLHDLIKKEIHDALCEIGQSHVVQCRRRIFKRKSGRIYVINGSFHQASAPFESPANLSGELARHVGYAVAGHTEMEFGDRSQQGKAPIGLFLEGGTVKMKPRPHVSETVKDQYKDTTKALEETMKKALK